MACTVVVLCAHSVEGGLWVGVCRGLPTHSCDGVYSWWLPMLPLRALAVNAFRLSGRVDVRVLWTVVVGVGPKGAENPAKQSMRGCAQRVESTG